MKNFKDKVVVITGAGSGIGRALAIRFASSGAALALNDYQEEGLKETVELVKLDASRILSSQFDVSDRASMMAFKGEVLDKFNHVDVVINNAGIALDPILFKDIELENLDRLMDINFGGVLNGSYAFLPSLLERPEASLVNVASVFGLTGVKTSTAYTSSKFAVYGLTQSLRLECRGTGVSVASVHPAGVRTNIIKNRYADTKMVDQFYRKFFKLTPEQAAQTILKGIQRKKGRILIGRDAYLIDWAIRFSPVMGANLINNVIQKTRDEMEAMKRKLEANGDL